MLIFLLSTAAQVTRRRREPPDPDTVTRIVVFQMSGVGDLLLITPALRALHSLYPQASFDILTYNLQNATFLFRLPYVKEGCEFPLFDLRLKHIWSPKLWRSFGKTIRFMRRKVTDIYITFHHTWLPQWYFFELGLAACSGARFRVGINPSYAKIPGVFDRAILESSLGTRHYRPFFMDVVRLLGEVKNDLATEFPLDPREIEEAHRNIQLTIPGHRWIVCLHVGASHPSQLWPIDRFAELAGRLVAEGCGIVLIGTEYEQTLTQRVAATLPQESCFNAAGTTNLFQMAALIDSAHLFIGNDSGPMHVAIARRRPTIGLIGPGKPRYHNYDTREAVILINQESGHSLHGTEFKNAPCHWNISVTQVYEQAADFLSLGNSSS